MKNILSIFRLSSVAIAILILSACSKSGDPTPTDNTGGITGGGTTGGGTTGGGTTGGGSSATVTTPNTQFLAQQDYSVSNAGAYSTQQFTLSAATKLVFRFTSQYQAQAAIIAPDQLSNFQGNKSFTGYGIFDKQLGINPLTLAAGTYYLAIRNASTGANKWSVELDYAITLPSSDKASYYDTYVSGAKSLTAGTRFWQPFTVQTGYRYFLDGCNVNCDVRVISANQLAAFQGNQTYQYFTDYYQAGGASPGLSELRLPAGDYYLVSYNSAAGALVYNMERWKLN
jgi:hypothetical protein